MTHRLLKMKIFLNLCGFKILKRAVAFRPTTTFAKMNLASSTPKIPPSSWTFDTFWKAFIDRTTRCSSKIPWRSFVSIVGRHPSAKSLIRFSNECLKNPPIRDRHRVFTIVLVSIRWLKVYDHLLKIYDLLLESIRSSKILLQQNWNHTIIRAYDWVSLIVYFQFNDRIFSAKRSFRFKI